MEKDLGDVRQFKVNTVKSMWKLKEKYCSYRIFVWLENEGDVDVFVHLSFSGIRVEGFCNDQLEKMESFFNKRVVDVRSIICDSNVIIVYGREKERKSQLEKDYLVIKSLLLTFEDLFEVRKEMWANEAVLLYDSAKAVKRVAKLLETLNIKVIGSCPIMNKSTGNILPEKRVFDQAELLDNKYNIVLASKRLYCEETISCFINKNTNIFVPSMDIFYSTKIITLWGKMALNLNKAMENGKKFCLYGTDSCYTNDWLIFLDTVGIRLEKILDDCENMELAVDSIYELAYENPEDIYIILNKKIAKWEESCDLLESMGFAFNRMYTGLYAVSYRHLPKLTDITLGHVTAELLRDTKYEGFRVYGEELEGKYRIVILGGSTTTSEAYRVVCWPEILYKKLTRMGYDIIIYNGAVDGYTASDELHKLIRDVRCLRPDLVISFSGVNNRFKTQHPYVSAYLIQVFEEIYADSFCKGLSNDDSVSMAQIWVEQERMMEAICKEVYGAEFICFVQPMYVSKNVLRPCERLQFEKNRMLRSNDLNYRKEISEQAEQLDWMIDLQSFLDNDPDVFMDEAHVYEEGNHMIAEEICRHMINAIPK